MDWVYFGVLALIRCINSLMICHEAILYLRVRQACLLQPTNYIKKVCVISPTFLVPVQSVPFCRQKFLISVLSASNEIPLWPQISFQAESEQLLNELFVIWDKSDLADLETFHHLWKYVKLVWLITEF